MVNDRLGVQGKLIHIKVNTKVTVNCDSWNEMWDTATKLVFRKIYRNIR